MPPQKEPVAVEATRSVLATGTVMLVGGLAIVAVAVARGLAWRSAFHAYLWSGLWFAGLWSALMLVVGGGYWIWKRTRKRATRETPELPADIRVGGMREAWTGAARSQARLVVFLTLVALIQPRFGAALAGFSLLAVTLVPMWLYWRLRWSKRAYLVRGPGRQRRWYVGRSPGLIV